MLHQPKKDIFFCFKAVLFVFPKFILRNIMASPKFNCVRNSYRDMNGNRIYTFTQFYGANTLALRMEEITDVTMRKLAVLHKMVGVEVYIDAASNCFYMRGAVEGFHLVISEETMEHWGFNTHYNLAAKNAAYGAGASPRRKFRVKVTPQAPRKQPAVKSEGEKMSPLEYDFGFEDVFNNHLSF